MMLADMLDRVRPLQFQVTDFTMHCAHGALPLPPTTTATVNVKDTLPCWINLLYQNLRS